MGDGNVKNILQPSELVRVLVQFITILSHDMLISEEIIILSTRSHSREVNSFFMTLKALRLGGR